MWEAGEAGSVLPIPCSLHVLFAFLPCMEEFFLSFERGIFFSF